MGSEYYLNSSCLELGDGLATLRTGIRGVRVQLFGSEVVGVEGNVRVSQPLMYHVPLISDGGGGRNE